MTERQPLLMSRAEAVADAVVGYGVAVLVQMRAVFDARGRDQHRTEPGKSRSTCQS
jgi:hypothetical protein